jgi:fructokinase
MQDHYLGVDVGGTKTEVCLLVLDPGADFRSYQVAARERMETGRTTSLVDFLNRLESLIEQVLLPSGVRISDLKGVGIGLPGSINPKTQIMQAGSIPFFLNVPLLEPFRKKLKFTGPMIFDNDANCFALAEAYFGAGAEWARANHVPISELCMIGVTLGTGVGGGLIVRGELVRGRRGGAGEVGHMTLVESGRPCYCGRFGCSEQYLSGPAFQQSYVARASALKPLPGTEIFKLVEEGHPLAIATLEHYRDYLVTFLSNLSNCLDPHVIVLGGGMSTQSRIYAGIADRLSRECFLTANPPAVVPYQCGESAGVIGAAMLSYELREARAGRPA